MSSHFFCPPLREKASWQKNALRSVGNPTWTPEEAQREDWISLLGVRKRVPARLQTGAAPADPHGRETLLLLRLRPRLQPEGKSEDALQSPLWWDCNTRFPSFRFHYFSMYVSDQWFFFAGRMLWNCTTFYDVGNNFIILFHWKTKIINSWGVKRCIKPSSGYIHTVAITLPQASEYSPID